MRINGPAQTDPSSLSFTQNRQPDINATFTESLLTTSSSILNMNSFSNQNGPNYKPIRSSKSQDGDESVECQDDGIEVYMFLPRWASNASFLSGNFKIHFISCLPWVTVCILLALLGYSHVSRPLNAQLLYCTCSHRLRSGN